MSFSRVLIFSLLLSTMALFSSRSSGLEISVCPTRTVSAGSFGSITSPAYPKTYPNNLNCVLTLKVPAYFSITISFQWFSIEYDGGCRKDKLYISDGRGRPVPRCGVRGSSVPRPKTFDTRELKVEFITDAAVGKRGFHINYNLTAQPQRVPGVSVCPTRTITATSKGAIHSPNFPAKYGPNLKCVLTVQLPPNFMMTLWFEQMKVQYSATCAKDALVIKDGKGGTTSCGYGTPPPKTFRGQQVQFDFTTDATNEDAGFLLHYNLTATPTFPPVSGVSMFPSRTITAQMTGAIYSPQFPSNYGSNSNVVLTLRIPVNFMVTMWFDSFNMEYSSSCAKDKLEIKDNRGTKTTLCGSGKIAPLKFYGNEVTLTLVTDGSGSGTGFLLQYNLTAVRPTVASVSVSPTRTITAQRNGAISSPQFPSNYRNNVKSVLTLRVPAGSMITMWFDSFQMEHSLSCSKDKLVIRDNTGKSQILCGSGSPPPMKFYGNEVTLTFVSDGSGNGKGFLMRYNLTNVPVKGVSITPSRTVTAQSFGSILSPQYPSSYGNNINSVLTVKVPPGFMMTMWSDNFNMENSSSCSKDKLEIRDNKGAQKIMCGSRILPPMKFYGNEVTLTFKSDGSGSGSGFVLLYNLTASPITGVSVTPTRTVTAQSFGSILSPQYPSSYGNNINSVLTVKVPPGFMMTMWSDNFNMEYSSSCSKDKLEIRDNRGARRIMCGQGKLSPMKFYGNEMTLTFKSDGSGSGSGFVLLYNLTATPTTEKPPVVKRISVYPSRTVQAGKTGFISSPNYPANYGRNLTSSLILNVPDDNMMTLWFDHFQMEYSISCTKDKLQITDNKGASYVLCGKLSPVPMMLYGSEVTLTFVTDGSGSDDGFLLGYNLTSIPRQVPDNVCSSKTITASKTGAISSPLYPSNYENNLNCVFILRIPENFLINIWFDSFAIQTSEKCTKDQLLVEDDLGRSHVFCGPHPIPPRMTFYGHQVTLTFKTDPTINYNGFLLRYSLSPLPKGDCVRIGLPGRPQPAYIEAQDYGGKSQRMQNEIKFDFKTDSDGVIAFAKAPRDNDYFYVGLEGGCLFFEANLGTGVGCAGVAGPNLKDNNWHNVVITRNGRRLSIVVDGVHKRSGLTPGGYSKLDFYSTSGYIFGVPDDIKRKYPKLRLGKNFLGLIRGLSIDGNYPTQNVFSGANGWIIRGKESITVC